MTDRRAEQSKASRVADDEWIVVPYRPGRHSAKLLPPILLVLLGTAFLTYRARSSDWRGVSLLFETRPKPAVVPDPPACRGRAASRGDPAHVAEGQAGAGRG